MIFLLPAAVPSVVACLFPMGILVEMNVTVEGKIICLRRKNDDHGEGPALKKHTPPLQNGRRGGLVCGGVQRLMVYSRILVPASLIASPSLTTEHQRMGPSDSWDGWRGQPQKGGHSIVGPGPWGASRRPKLRHARRSPKSGTPWRWGPGDWWRLAAPPPGKVSSGRFGP